MNILKFIGGVAFVIGSIFVFIDARRDSQKDKKADVEHDEIFMRKSGVITGYYLAIGLLIIGITLISKSFE